MMSKFFIERPVLANVLAIVIVLLGLVALLRLPIAQYPEIVPPTVQVTTRYPGASALDLMNTVALPIEQQVNGVERMIYMQSTSASDGTYTLTVTFEIGTDLNFAQVLVQNRVSSALAQLPQAVQVQGVKVQKVSTAILQFVTLTSPKGTYDALFLSNYASINVTNELARLSGVGNVNVLGAGSYSMRVWMNPNAMQSRGITTQDVTDALQEQNQQVTAGQVGMPPVGTPQDFQLTLVVGGRLTEVPQFEEIIVKTGQDGAVTRLRDIARVELGAQSYGQVFNLNGKPAAGIAIYQTPGSNALDVAHEVAAKMAVLSKAFPQDLTYQIPFDTTVFVNASITEVYKTLIEAGVLVLIVILVFLQDWRATLVPATTVPVTIIGAFAAMALLGFSINLSTLFAIVLAIGIVVDDAIVIVEGAAHKIEQGFTPHDAAIKAMDELFGPIIGITLVLMSVFVPAAFLPGITGQIFRQFALVIAATALISAINAATLKPTQCASYLRPQTPPEQRNAFFRGFNAIYNRFEDWYAGLIARMVAHSRVLIVVALTLIGLAFWGITKVPTGFLPIEDQGYVVVGVQLPSGASLGRTSAVMDQVTAIARANPAVENVVAISGLSLLDNNATSANSGVAYVILKDWSVRGSALSLLPVFLALNQALYEKIDDAITFVIVPPPIQGIGNSSGFQMQVELRDGSTDFNRLHAMTEEIVRAADSQSSIVRTQSPFQVDVPQIRIEVNRTKAETLKVTVGQVFQTLASYVGSSYVGQFNKFGQTYQVYIQADSNFRLSMEEVANLPVRNEEGNMVPLGTILASEPTAGPSIIQLYNLYPSATIVGGSAPGFSSGQALALMEQIAGRNLPNTAGFDWTAMSFQEKAVGNQLFYAFGLGILLVYLVLAGQYESWLAPASVILAVPLVLLGPIITLNALRLDNNLYTQIGLILLIALGAKNAILIVEVAREERVLHGKGIIESAVYAARARLRAILMTSFAFILGVMPLVLASGAGAAARKYIGITVSTGMLASTCLAVLFVPVFFVVIQTFEEWLGRDKTKTVTQSTPAE